MSVEPNWKTEDIGNSHNITRFIDDEALNIQYNFASVYLIIIIGVGLFLNVKAIISLVEVIKVNFTLCMQKLYNNYELNIQTLF